MSASAALVLQPVDNAHFDDAATLIARYPGHPLRTLDALHLAVAGNRSLDTIATADAVMADAANAMGFTVARF